MSPSTTSSRSNESMNTIRQEVSSAVSAWTWVWAAFSRLPIAGLRRSWKRIWNSSLRSTWALHAWWWFGPAAAAAAAVVALTG